MDLYSLKNIIKIRWDKFHIIKDGNWYSCNNDFELTPDDFLNFAKDEKVEGIRDVFLYGSSKIRIFLFTRYAC